MAHLDGPPRIVVPTIGEPQLPPPVVVEYRDQDTKELKARIMYPQVYVALIADDVLPKIAAYTAHFLVAELERRGVIPAPPQSPAEPSEPPRSSTAGVIESETDDADRSAADVMLEHEGTLTEHN